MKVYFNAFWSGFFDKTNPNHCDFFLDLFTKIWNEPMEIGTKENSEVLCETIFDTSVLFDREWKYSVLFSGESRLQKDPIDHLYTIVLYGQRNNGNRINCPLFVPYLYCNKTMDKLVNQVHRSSIPMNSVLAVISNPNGSMRNRFLEALEKKVSICYGGNYKNNLGGTIVPSYHTPEFTSFVSNFKFVVTMENSREDTYITEKICHGMFAQTIPIYWGSPRVTDYFNKDRFLCVDDDASIDSVVNQIVEMMDDDTKWLEMVNRNVFTNGTSWRTIDTIAEDCRNLLKQHIFKPIQKIYFICNETYEPHRYERLNYMMSCLNIPSEAYRFKCPTFKHTISDEQYAKHTQTPFKELIPWCDRKLRRSELSITLNYRSILQEIDKNYMDGLFLILESDVIFSENIQSISSFLQSVERKKDKWNCIHIGYGNNDQFWKTPFQESLTNESDTYRLSRHLSPRCADSLLWTKEGIEQVLEHMMITEDYSEPWDHYIGRYFKNNQDKFSLFWSRPTFFVQLSTHGNEQSTIQNDTD